MRTTPVGNIRLMRIAAASLLTIAAAAAVPAVALAAPGDAMDVFQQVCVAGSGRFPAGVLTPVTRPSLPAPVRHAVAAAPKETLFQLTSDTTAYLIVQDSAVGEPANVRSCTVATDRGRFGDAVSTLTGRPVSENAAVMLEAEGRYRATGADGAKLAADMVRPHYVIITRQTSAATP